MITIDNLNKMNKYELQELFNLYIIQLDNLYLQPLMNEADKTDTNNIINMLSSIFDVANNKIVVENKQNYNEVAKELAKAMRNALG
jgi:hypothetical protein